MGATKACCSIISTLRLPPKDIQRLCSLLPAQVLHFWSAENGLLADEQPISGLGEYWKGFRVASEPGPGSRQPFCAPQIPFSAGSVPLAIWTRSPLLARQAASTKVQSVASASRGLSASAVRSRLPPGPGLKDFIIGQGQSQLPELKLPSEITVPYLEGSVSQPVGAGRVFFETYGCQMNTSDMEIVLAIMKEAGYTTVVDAPEDADVILINTCAIRDNAERKVWHRLGYFKNLKRGWRDRRGQASSLQPPKVAVLGCMAERLKASILDAQKLVDVVCGPDAYRDLPRLLADVDSGQAGVNVLLSIDETYADVSPVRIAQGSSTAFVSIMRGCDNMCSYCIVPFTRGRERSRPLGSIAREVGELWAQGVKEVTLLGQNVNSYCDLSDRAASISASPSAASLSPGFSTIYKQRIGGLRFAHLLDHLSSLYPDMRFRFTSPHPKDFPADLIGLIRDRPNVCSCIHLPAQSGSSRVLKAMRRGYTRDAYLALVDQIRHAIPDIALTSDFISGFCGETEEDHRETLTLMEQVGYDMAFMFAYSMREKTHAHRQLVDDVAEEVKLRRLAEVIEVFRATAPKRYEAQVGCTQLVLIEGTNKRDPERELVGRNDFNHKVVLPKILGNNGPMVKDGEKSREICPGDFVEVVIESSSSASLRGIPVKRTSLKSFASRFAMLNVGPVESRSTFQEKQMVHVE